MGDLQELLSEIVTGKERTIVAGAFSSPLATSSFNLLSFSQDSRRWWHNSAMALNRALPNDLFKRLGVPNLPS